MSNIITVEKDETVEFKWKKKRGVGRNKVIQFYESFIYDGVEYTLHDCAYFYKEGEIEPYVGKLIKIWENEQAKVKKVKVLWFFRPSDISNFLGGEVPLENELFLASGEGVGLFNCNPLEAICGKCNVVCVSKDSRNPQPSPDELRKADFIFYRTFDVGKHKILDTINEKIADVEVKFIFNRNECQNANSVLERGPAKAEDGGVTGISNDTQLLSKPKTSAEGKEDANAKAARRRVESADQPSRDVTEELKKDSDTIEGRERRNFIKHSLIGEKLKSSKDSVKNNAENSVRDAKNARPVEQGSPSSHDNRRFKRPMDSHGRENFPSKKLKADDNRPDFSNGKSHKAWKSTSENGRNNGQFVEVNLRTNTEKNTWYKGLPWEERIEKARQQGTLVLLQNLDPSYTSAEVEDIVRDAFKEICTAKMMPRMAISSPFSGVAFVICKKSEVAQMMVRKLDEECLLLSNGRALVGTMGTDVVAARHSPFFGHLNIDKVKYLIQREMKQAVSTSHCSQPNTIEYEMAMDWRLLQSRSGWRWDKMYKKQREEMTKLRATLNSK